jgi:N-acetylmuramic acid 6-phosphate (MurNAc-6-P) etherase
LAEKIMTLTADDYTHVLLIRGSLTTAGAEKLVFARISTEVAIVSVEPYDGHTMVRLDVFNLKEEALEIRLNNWMNDQIYLDNQLLTWWNTKEENE